MFERLRAMGVACCLATGVLLVYAGCGTGSDGGTADPRAHNFDVEGPTGTAQSAILPAEADPQPNNPDYLAKGIDCLRTVAGTSVNFAQTPIPAGFFYAGSPAFTGSVGLVHRGDHSDDTCMKRYFDMDFTGKPLGTTLTTPIRLIELDMAGDASIQVGGTYWKLETSVSTKVPPAGTMFVTKSTPTGGTFLADFYVYFVAKFTKCTDARCQTLTSTIRTFDTGNTGTPMHMSSKKAITWAQSSSPDCQPSVNCQNVCVGMQCWCLASKMCNGSVVEIHPPPPGCVAASEHAACPPGVDPNICGNGVIDPANLEACDGLNWGGQTCATQTNGLLPDGNLRCDLCCRFDTSGCCNAAPLTNCGNGVIDPGEECDGVAFPAGATCASQTNNAQPNGSLGCGCCKIVTTSCCP